MSFASEVKTELCRTGLARKCCAQAEAYGVLLYCNTFSGREVRIVTESDAFAQRLPQTEAPPLTKPPVSFPASKTELSQNENTIAFCTKSSHFQAQNTVSKAGRSP